MQDKVAIYIRVSTKRQIDTYSPNEQKRILTEYAKNKEWEIHDIYSDLGESGSEAERDDLDRLLIDANRKLFGRVLLFEQDRLSRLEQLDWAYLANSLAKLGVKLVTPTSEINLDNEEDRFLADLFNLLANRELKKIKKRTSMGRKAASNQGVYFGRTPYGVNLDRETQTWNAIKEEVEIVKLIFSLYDIDFGFRKVANKLNSLGYKSKEGTVFRASTISRIICCPVCIGEFEQTILGETICHKMKWQIGHGPFIKIEDFNKAREIMIARGDSQLFKEPNFLLTGVLFCKECGRRFKVQGNQSFLASGEKKIYYYYAHRNATKINCRCRHNMFEIDNKIRETLKEMAGNPEVIKKLFSNQPDAENIDNLNKQLLRCKSDKEKIFDKKGRLLDLYMDGSWTKDELELQKKKLDNEIVSLGNRESEITRKIQGIIARPDMKSIADKLLVFRYFDKELEPAEQNKLLRQFISKVLITKDGEMEFTLSLDFGNKFVQSFVV